MGTITSIMKDNLKSILPVDSFGAVWYAHSTLGNSLPKAPSLSLTLFLDPTIWSDSSLLFVHLSKGEQLKSAYDRCDNLCRKL